MNRRRLTQFILATVLGLLPALAGGSVTFSSLTAGSSTAGTTSYATASVTPIANKVVFLFTAARLGSGNGPQPVSSITSTGMVWSLIPGAVLNSGITEGTGKEARLEVWCGIGASPSASAITISWTTTPSGVSWGVDQSSGAASTCASAVGNINTATADSATASPLSVTLSFGSASNATYGAGATDDHSGSAVGQGAGFIELSPSTAVIPSTETEYASGNVSPVTITYAGPTARWGIIAIEVKVPTTASAQKRPLSF